MYEMATKKSPDIGGQRPAKAEKLAATVQSKASSTRSKARDVEAKAAEHIARFEQLADGLETIAVWLRDQPGARRPRWSRDEIAAAAVELVDAEGLDALSMRRLATVLGAGTMSLYHYVKTKDELLALVFDAVMGEVLVEDDEVDPADWQGSLRAIARRSRDSLLRHPWIFDVTDDTSLGPNAVRHFDQTIGALTGVEADLDTKLDVIFTVDEYVFGYCLQRRHDMEGHHQSEAPGMAAYTESLIATGHYPNVAALVAEHGSLGLLRRIEALGADVDRFDRNLDRLLTGIAAGLGLAGGDSAPKGRRR